jgi:AmmeMemoRadiSam system protein B
MTETRQAVYAGSWYPGDKDELAGTVDKLLAAAPAVDLPGSVKALIVPHAGFYYSGAIAAAGFAQVPKSTKRVFLLGPSHRHPLRGLSILDVGSYQTPLGLVPLDSICQELRQEIGSVPLAHAEEHSLEIELPFLQRQLDEFTLVPLLVGEIDSKLVTEFLIKNMAEEDLLVISCDLSHFHPYEQAAELDKAALGHISKLESSAILKAEIDAPWAVSALLQYARAKGWQPRVIKYANSGDISGDHSQVVGYAAVAFCG